MPSAADPVGTVRISHYRVWRIAGPIILSNMSVPLLGAVDTAVVGHLPDPAYIGAVAVGAIIFNFLYWGVGFLRMGTTGFVAQASGARNLHEIRAILARGMLVGFGLALAMLALQVPIGTFALWLMEASDDVETLARAYFDIRIWGAPAALANYVILGWLLGMQRAGWALVLQLFMNGLNIALDLLFVLGFGWGVEGVALATVISEYSAVALAILIVGRLLPTDGGWSWARIKDPDRIRAFVSLNADIMIRTMGLIFAFAYFTAQGAKAGDVILAANAVLLHFVNIMAFGLDGFAFAAEALVGGAIGARDRDALRRAVVISTIWAGLVSVLFAAGYIAVGPTIIAVLTGIEAVRTTAEAYLPWVIAYPVVAIWAFQLDGIFFGATRGPEMRNAMVISVAGFLAAVHLLMPIWGNHGLWLAFTLFAALRGLSLASFYPRIERAVSRS